MAKKRLIASLLSSKGPLNRGPFSFVHCGKMVVKAIVSHGSQIKNHHLQRRTSSHGQ